MLIQIFVAMLLFMVVNGQPHFTSVYKNETDGQIYLDVKGIANSIFEEQHELLKLINNILDQMGPKVVVEGDYLPTMIKFLNSKNSTIQTDTLLTLFRIANASSEFAEAIFDENAIPSLLENIHSNDFVTSTLSFDILKIILKHDFPSMTQSMTTSIATNLIKLLNSETSSTNSLQNALILLTSLSRKENTPLSSNEINEMLIPAIAKLLKHSAPEIILMNIASFGMLTLTDERPKQLEQLFFDDEIIKDLFQHVNHKDENIQRISLFVLGNLLASESHHHRIPALLDERFFETFSTIFENGPSKNILGVVNFLQKLFTLTNIHIETFIKSSAFSSLMKLLEKENMSRDDVMLVLLVTAIHADLQHILLLDQMNIIPKLCNVFVTSVHKGETLLKTTLITISTILQKSGEYKCVIFEKLEKCGGMELIYDLEKTHEDDEIINASRLITSLNRLQILKGTCSKQF